MKIGLFGGSFDPIHNGHLMLAEQAKTQLGLDEIVFIPCGESPYLNKKIKTSSEHRFLMIFYTINEIDNMFIDSIEIYKKERTYTIDTVKYFIAAYPQHELYLILGPDITPKSFMTWKDAKEIKRLVKVAFTSKDFWIPDVGIRSTLIRQMVKEGKSIKYLVPDSVEQYIKEKGLYK